VKILVLAPFDAAELERLRSLGEVTYESWMEHRHLHSPDELAARLNADGYDVVVVEAEFVTRDVMETAQQLRVIATARGKPVQIDLTAATELGRVVLQTPGRNADSVADLTMGMIIDRVRHIVQAANAVVEGQWVFGLEDDDLVPYVRFRGHDLAGRLLGLIGFGAVAREVSRRALAFKMRVLAYDPYLGDADFVEAGVERAELDDLMRTCDIVSLHVELNPSTEGLLSADKLKLMKRGAIFVNTARAKVTDQDALTELTLSGHLGGVALDVFHPEPAPADHPLLRCERALILPHIGGATDDVVRNHSVMIREDLERLSRGERPLRCANPEVLEAILPQA
jgi:D-3-phosphoglycerate dehydrogenase / 2-oxoglutarate reductase